MKIFVHCFNGGQLGNQLRLQHDFLSFCTKYHFKYFSYSDILYLFFDFRCFRAFYKLDTPKPPKILYLIYLYFNIYLFRLLLALLLRFPFLRRFYAVAIPSPDVEYFGFNLKSSPSYFMLDSHFASALPPITFCWGYYFFYLNKDIIDFRLDTSLAPFFLQRLCRYCKLNSIDLDPFILVHVRRLPDFAQSLDFFPSDELFLEGATMLSKLLGITNIKITSDGSSFANLISLLSNSGFNVTISSACASMGGTPKDLFYQYSSCSGLVAPPSTLAVFYSKLLNKPHFYLGKFDQ